MATQTKYENFLRGESRTLEAPLAFDAIREPGVYVCHWSGHLLRIPKETISISHAGRMSLVSNEKPLVTRIGSDPDMPVTKARVIAREAGLSITF